MKWGIYLICAFLPTYLIRFEIFGLPITVLEVMILILFATWLIRGGYKNVIPAKAGIHSFVIPAKAGIHSFVIPAKA
ncbi:MAG: hypothetical protein U9P90_04770, partial [Patescibacteria group bacterium]|nr:hypothetical protein [Patescibacteria group bacterium]